MAPSGAAPLQGRLLSPLPRREQGGRITPLPSAVPVVAALPQLFQVPPIRWEAEASCLLSPSVQLCRVGQEGRLSQRRPRCRPFSLISGQNMCSSDPCCLSHISGSSLTLFSPISLSVSTVGSSASPVICSPLHVWVGRGCRAHTDSVQPCSATEQVRKGLPVLQG